MRKCEKQRERESSFYDLVKEKRGNKNQKIKLRNQFFQNSSKTAWKYVSIFKYCKDTVTAIEETLCIVSVH